MQQDLVGEQGAGASPARLRRVLTLRQRRTSAAIIGVLVACDALAIAGAFALAYVLRFKAFLPVFYVPPTSPLRFYSALVFLLIPLVVAILACYRLYLLPTLFDEVDEYTRVMAATLVALAVVVLLSFFLDTGLVISRAWIAISGVTLSTCLLLCRFLVRRVVYALRRAGHLSERVIVVGGGAEVARLAEYLQATPASGFQVAQVVSPDECGESADPAEEGETPLRRLIASARADAVIVNAASVSQEQLGRIVRQLADLPTELRLLPGMHEILTTGVRVREVRGLPLVTMNKVRITGFDRVVKQALDYAVAATALLVLAPLLLGVALAVRLTSPGPILHRRWVIGQRGRRFAALKFRTMYVDGAAILRQHPELAARLAREGKLVDDPRVTGIGRWLRRWSLDELPQLVNVLRGQMSLVGPRMITEDERHHFGQWRDNLLTVKPGLTGLWQISGRSTLGYEERVRLDMHYIRSYSLWSDIAILLSTIPIVIRGTGAY